MYMKKISVHRSLFNKSVILVVDERLTKLSKTETTSEKHEATVKLVKENQHVFDEFFANYAKGIKPE